MLFSRLRPNETANSFRDHRRDTWLGLALLIFPRDATWPAAEYDDVTN